MKKLLDEDLRFIPSFIDGWTMKPCRLSNVCSRMNAPKREKRYLVVARRSDNNNQSLTLEVCNPIWCYIAESHSTSHTGFHPLPALKVQLLHLLVTELPTHCVRNERHFRRYTRVTIRSCRSVLWKRDTLSRCAVLSAVTREHWAECGSS